MANMISDMTNTGSGVILMGEAAKDWVALEWAKFYVALGFIAFLILQAGLFLMAIATDPDEP